MFTKKSSNDRSKRHIGSPVSEIERLLKLNIQQQLHYINTFQNIKDHNPENPKKISNYLASETVEGPALPLQSIHNVHGGDGLPTSMLSIGNSIANHVLEENLEHPSGLLVD